MLNKIVNPLGPKRMKYKSCAFYYTVGNVGVKFRSHLKHIHLALLVRHSHLKQFGMDVILKPLIDDLKQLSMRHCKCLWNRTQSLCCFSDGFC